MSANLIDQLVDPPKGGAYKWSGDKICLLNSILRGLARGDFIAKGTNILITQLGSAGYSQTAQIESTSAPNGKNPFQISATKNIVAKVWDGTYNIGLNAGTVNQQIATNMFSVINQAITSTQYIILTCSNDGLALTTFDWSVVSSQPAPLDATADLPPDTFYILVGAITYDATTGAITIFQIVNTNLTASPKVWTTTTRPGVTNPFQMNTLNYYAWQIAEA